MSLVLIRLKIFWIISFVTIFFYLQNFSYAQDNWWKEKKYSSEAKRIKFYNCKKAFIDIGDGLNYNNVYLVVPYLTSDVYLNIMENEKGYYSIDQAQNIIDNFLHSYPVNSFKWKISNRSENYAFALGKYKYKKDGYINSYEISVSLKYLSGLWIIDQIIVN
jgi:hypothetical protein